MRGFSPDILQTIALFGVFLTFAAYLIVAAITAMKSATRGRIGIDSFLRFRVVGDSGIDSDGLRKSLMVSALSLGTAIYVYLEWGASEDGLFALWSPITWTLGALTLYSLSKKIFTKSRTEWTLHAFLGNNYSSPFLAKLTSGITITFFLLQISAEIYVGVNVLGLFVFPELSKFEVAVVLCLLYVIYSIVGGLPSVISTDKVQYWIITLSIFGLLLVLLNHYGQSGVAQLKDSLSTFEPTSFSHYIIIISLLAINVPLFITDMSVWQRIGAVDDEKDAKEGILGFTIGLFFVMSLLVLIGVSWGSTVMVPDGQTAVIAFLTFIGDTIAFPVLLVGFVAAILSTADTFLISAVQTGIVDWKYRKEFIDNDYNPSRMSRELNLKMTRDSRIGVLLFGFIAAIIGYLSIASAPALLDLLFVVFAIPIGMAPSLVMALLDKSNVQDRSAAEWSVSISFLVGIITFILAFVGVEFLSISLAFWSPILVLATSTILFFGIKKYRS